MRKCIKKQLMELLVTIKDSIDYAVSIKKNKEQSENILIDCYSAFSHIKKCVSENLTIEKFGEYESCIDAIQNDMEILNDNIQNKNEFGEIFEELNSKISKLSKMIKNESVRLEVVFLPYKASMWDSLESIWQVANEDENCTAYVIPIPYYDRNPDGSLREEHYEKEEFPDYVPIMHYKDYNFELRKPDMIFIHNPYDNNNFITTVHPFFYSNNLKKLTEKLVYIPYFVLDDIEPNDKMAVEHIAHFCTNPGVLNADVVIVQSENMRKIYIDVLDNAAKDSGIKREYWEKKILGLGSPKFDRLTNTKKDDLEIPNKWREIIEKPDGNKKKIILYNTGLSAFLENNEAMLDKIKSVLRTFKENKEDIALLWRPHPLIKATLISMRPNLCEEYEKIVCNYLSEGWGIYDDTPDNDRAMILSDAYYGDWSSLVTLYKRTGKPIIIQNCYVP